MFKLAERFEPKYNRHARRKKPLITCKQLYINFEIRSFNSHFVIVIFSLTSFSFFSELLFNLYYQFPERLKVGVSSHLVWPNIYFILFNEMPLHILKCSLCGLRRRLCRSSLGRFVAHILNRCIWLTHAHSKNRNNSTVLHIY